MDLQAWIIGELEATRRRFHGAIATHVPRGRWRERADGGGSSIAGLLLHVTVHQDVALHAALLGQEPMFARRAAGLGLGPGAEPLPSLEEAEDPEITASLDLDAVEGYADEVHRAALTWMGQLRLGEAGLEAGLNAGLDADLDAVPPASARLAEVGGVPLAAAPWLHDLWGAKPAAWFVQWELIGHAQGHVGEMVSVRDRLGYRPF